MNLKEVSEKIASLIAAGLVKETDQLVVAAGDGKAGKPVVGWSLDNGGLTLRTEGVKRSPPKAKAKK